MLHGLKINIKNTNYSLWLRKVRLWQLQEEEDKRKTRDAFTGQLLLLKNYQTCVFADQGAEKHEGPGPSSGITDQEKELSTSAFQAFTVRNGFS